jgi:hypothetical protein
MHWSKNRISAQANDRGSVFFEDCSIHGESVAFGKRWSRKRRKQPALSKAQSVNAGDWK